MRPTRPQPRAGRTGQRAPRGSLRGSAQLRLRLGFIVIAMVLSVFAGRLVQLQGIDPNSYAAMAAAEGMVQVSLQAERGDILDRNGKPLADSVDGEMVVADPFMTQDDAPELAKFLANRLDLDYFSTLTKLREPDSRFEYIARRVPSTVATDTVTAAEEAGFNGIATRPDPIRDYPAGDVAANLVGFMGTDEPLAGLERTFDTQLAGKDGSARYEVGDGNRIPLGNSTIEPAQNGTDLHTTIDLDLQWYTQRVLAQTVQDSSAESGFAVVMDTRTGEVLAEADDPTFDANKPLESPDADRGARSMSDTYEPGSVEKVLTLSSLIDEGKVTPRTRLVVPGELDREDRPIHDWFPHGTIHLTLAGVIAKSSNIGTVLAADRFGARPAAVLPDEVRPREAHRHRGPRRDAGHPAEPEPVDPPGPGPHRLRPVALGERRADGRGRQHDRQRRCPGLAQPDPGLGDRRRRHRGRHRPHHHPPGRQRQGGPRHDAHDGARGRPRRRGRAGRGGPRLPGGRQDRHRAARR